MGLLRKWLVVFAVVVAFVGVMPPPEARAWAPPPVAPPPVVPPPVVTGPSLLGACLTPAGLIFCGAAVAGGVIWVINEVSGESEPIVPQHVGPAPTEDGWQWCAWDIEHGKICWDEHTNERILAQYTSENFGLPPTEVPIYAGTSGNYISPDPTQLQVYILRTESTHLALKEQGIAEIGAIGFPVADGQGWRFEVYGKLTGEVAPCGPPYEHVHGTETWPKTSSPVPLWRTTHKAQLPEWSSPCIAVATVGLPRSSSLSSASGGRVFSGPDNVTCSGGGQATVKGVQGFSGTEQAGLFGWVEAMCPPGETVTAVDFAGANVPNPVTNLGITLWSCAYGGSGWSHTTFSGQGPVNTCSNGSNWAESVNITMARVNTYEEIRGFASWRCLNADGSSEVRTVVGVGQPAFMGEAPVPTEIPCDSDQLPVSWEIAVCRTHDEVCAVTSTGSLEIDPEVNIACIVAMATPTPCPMWVEYFEDGGWHICVPEVSCGGWWSDPARDVYYRCGWGGDYYLASQCEALKDFYGDGVTVAPVNPAQPNPDPTTTGDPVQIGGPVGPPSSHPSRTWLQRLVTEWATGSLTGSWFDSCWPQGWGLLNPLQWVLRPIVCALTFLFVPTTPVVMQFEEFWEEVTTTTKLGLITDARELFESLTVPTPGGGCGWGIGAVDVGEFETPPLQLIMCPEDFNVSGTASTVRGLGYGVLGVWAAGMVYRWIGLGRSEDLLLEGDNVTGNL